MPGTTSETNQASGGAVKETRLAWTSDASGDVSGTPTENDINGVLLNVKFVPGSSGDQPSDNYDVTLLDADGIDVLDGLGADLSNAAGSIITPLAGDGMVHVRSTLNLVVANAGDTKSGEIVIYWR